MFWIKSDKVNSGMCVCVCFKRQMCSLCFYGFYAHKAPKTALKGLKFKHENHFISFLLL